MRLRKMKMFKAPLIKPDLILNATGVDSESLPIPGHDLSPQALIVEMAYYPAWDPLSAINLVNQETRG